jgi:hypothetical protein
LEILVLANGFSGPGKAKTYRLLADRAGRKLLICNESDLVLAAMVTVADEVEAGFRHYFPGLEFFLSHNVFGRGEPRGILSKTRFGGAEIESSCGKTKVLRFGIPRWRKRAGALLRSA